MCVFKLLLLLWWQCNTPMWVSLWDRVVWQWVGECGSMSFCFSQQGLCDEKIKLFLYQKTTGFLMCISKNQRFFDGWLKTHVSGQSPDTFTTWNSSRWYKTCDFKKESLTQHTKFAHLCSCWLFVLRTLYWLFSFKRCQLSHTHTGAIN